MSIAAFANRHARQGTAPQSPPAECGASPTGGTRTVRVWDLVVRVGHWMLVACFLIAWFSEGSPRWLHTTAGYGIAIVLAFRIPWGFLGTRHARFRDFLYPPREVIGYLRSLLARSPRHFLGHNPAGGLMVLALLIALAGTAGTGMLLYDASSGKGPVATVRLWSAGLPTDGSVKHQRDRKAAHFLEELHEGFANAAMLLVVLHVAGVVVSSALHRENLVRAMLTGRKTVRGERPAPE